MFDQNTVSRISAIAEELGVEPAALLAVAEVESGGTDTWMVDGRPMPPIRFEGHYFYKRLRGAKLAKAISAGLASPKAGTVNNPGSYSARYALYRRAEDINGQAAFESTSWGLGQVMGAHWSRLGFSSFTAMYDMACSGVGGQTELMARYIKAFNLVDELQSKGWKSFADQYNGPASAKNNYAAKIKAAYNRWSVADRVDPRVGLAKEWQANLKTLGYDIGPVDGKIGIKTKIAVRKFQKDHGLVDDGKIGPMTISAIEQELASSKRDRADNLTKVGSGATGVGTVGQVALEQAQSLQFVGSDSQVFQYAIAAITIIGLALVLFGVYSRFRHTED